MKRFIGIILLIVMSIVSFAGCNQPTIVRPDVGSNAQILDQKKIIFVGNSYTYYGHAVVEKKVTVSSQEERSNDQGYFYQICKSNGVEVSVTNWTYGGHTLSDSLGNCCQTDKTCKGRDHLSDLVYRNFDYVVLQNGSGSSGLSATEFVAQIKSFMKIFSDVNPDTKFVFLVQSAVHISSYDWKSAIKELEKEGLIIADWGNIVSDIINKKVAVPGAKNVYNKNSFIIEKSASDGYHPNMLSGYLTALTAYCAITGETAVGQAYSFCTDWSVNFNFDAQSFINKNYSYNNAKTNFVQIFNSQQDMKGLQTLVDRYLENKPYLNY